jgi:manganese/iron transport system substrate-binding protein
VLAAVLLRAGPRSLAFLAVAIGVASLAAAACGGNGEEQVPAGSHVRVATSLDLFGDLIEQVGGDRVQVTALVPSGSDPHTYEPVPGQVADVTKADVVFVNGVGLEQTLQSLIESNVGAGVPVVVMSEGLTPLGAGEEGEHGEGNPHFWLNVRYAMHYVERIRDALIQVDPAGETEYRAAADAYLAELEALDSDVAQAIDTIPAERRKLVTFHDAFPYFAERYGLEVVGFVIRSPGREPSAGEVADLVEEIRAEDVPAVFKEPQLRARVLELAADEAGVQVCTLYSGALDKEVDSYVKLIRHDADELVRCLR